jgi:transcriptional repressor NrdR
MKKINPDVLFVIFMKCIFCGAETKVVDKRTTDVTRRRRECLKCEKRFTTYERPELTLMVVKKDGRREQYSRDKLLAGVMKACEKRPIAQEKITATVDALENELRKTGSEVGSRKIGELVMKHLKRMDKVAYIRFASVYRSFDDIKYFEQEVKQLKKVASR